MKKILYYAMGLILLSGLVIGASVPQPAFAQTPAPKPKPATPQPGEIRIGLNVTSSGPAAAWGITYSKTITAQVEDINSEGGLLVGGKRYRIRVFEYDSKRDPATSLENAKKLIFTDKVMAIMHHGGVCVTPTLPILSENKIVSMDINTGAVVLRWPYNFVIIPATSVISINAYKDYVKRFGVKKVAEINPDNDSGYGAEVDDMRAAKQLGVEVVSHQFFPDDTTDFYPILTKAIAAKPDMIVIGLGSPGHVPIIIKQARELGWKGPMGMTQGAVGAVETVVKMAGDAAEDFVWTSPCHADRRFMSKQENEWMDYWLRRWGQPFIPDSFLSYKQFNLWVQALKKASSLNPDKITKALETGDFVVQGWKIHFGVTPDCYMGRPRALVAPMPINTIKEGKPVVIELLLPEGVERVN
jgi:ABC-type branched-subunit amino acid transport system substrate-binding protein